MKAAIYARYSSENQSEKSIDDQIRVCKKYIENNDMTIEDKHIYIDEAISGSIINRPGLQALERSAENREFDAVAVDDLSRLSIKGEEGTEVDLKIYRPEEDITFDVIITRARFYVPNLYSEVIDAYYCEIGH